MITLPLRHLVNQILIKTIISGKSDVLHPAPVSLYLTYYIQTNWAGYNMQFFYSPQKLRFLHLRRCYSKAAISFLDLFDLCFVKLRNMNNETAHISIIIYVWWNIFLITLTCISNIIHYQSIYLIFPSQQTIHTTIYYILLRFF